MKKTLIATFILLTIFACSHIQYKKNVKFEADESVQWITDSRELPANDSLFYLDNPMPLFRKEFAVEHEIDKATLFITAAGYYKASINSMPIGEN